MEDWPFRLAELLLGDVDANCIAETAAVTAAAADEELLFTTAFIPLPLETIVLELSS